MGNALEKTVVTSFGVFTTLCCFRLFLLQVHEGLKPTTTLISFPIQQAVDMGVSTRWHTSAHRCGNGGGRQARQHLHLFLSLPMAAQPGMQPAASTRRANAAINAPAAACPCFAATRTVPGFAQSALPTELIRIACFYEIFHVWILDMKSICQRSGV